MTLMLLGDFYAWYCEWCDTRNLTPWTKLEKNQLCCTACQKKFIASEEIGLPRINHESNSFRMTL